MVAGRSAAGEMRSWCGPNRELLDTAALCGHLVPAGSVYAFLAQHRRELFPDELFVDLFPSGRGRPSVPADVIATVMVLQSLEGLSGSRHARPGTHEYRLEGRGRVVVDRRGVSSDGVDVVAEQAAGEWNGQSGCFDAVRAVVDETGVLKGKTRRALDSSGSDLVMCRY